MPYSIERKTVALLSAGLISTFVAASATLAQDVALTEGPATIWDGVYTAEQADRGQSLFTENCSSCHGSQAGGGPAGPPLAGSTLDAKADTPVAAMIDYMIAAMPPESPGRLRTREYVDIMAFILEVHGAPAGETELPPTVADLNDITFATQPEDYAAPEPSADVAPEASAPVEESEAEPFNDGH
ncbi:c-type cytochrome [Pelagibacterium luteolum]|uniref:Cytochrome C oxidase, cbb3-type, subunit III n=1 Tax=Pelagibacterium luteolum TaxID=440168 RepID=A0A1G7XY79_9HYPH|nr:c-type cytochrome [Pelagibacterium luteolum]SDG89129.1 Cytochrome C oxidase, cbb3-type, subunit III [Pelagibacterium luteolum]